MSTQNASTTAVYGLIRNSDGEIMSWAGEIIYPKSLNTSEVKESVDTGEFIPGVYRVNEYFVSKDWYTQLYDTVRVEYDSGVYTYHTTLTGGFMHYLLSKSLIVSPPSTSQIEGYALQKTYAKIAQADLEFGVEIGELKSTIESLRHPLKNLRDFLKKNGNWAKLAKLATVPASRRGVGKQAASSAASTWMEIRYGLRPLIYSVQDIIDLVNAKTEEIFDPQKIRSVRATAKQSSEELNFFGGTLGYCYFEGESRLVDKQKAFASVQYRQHAPTTLATQLGLTPGHLPEIAWELTRLSFVVDWILAVGPWLGSLRHKPNITVLGNTVGVKHERTIDIAWARARWYSKTQSWATIDSDATYRKHEYERKKDVDLPILPQFTALASFDLFKAVDSLAIIWQQFAKR